jgi:hypothetical protein
MVPKIRDKLVGNEIPRECYFLHKSSNLNANIIFGVKNLLQALMLRALMCTHARSNATVIVRCVLRAKCF